MAHIIGIDVGGSTTKIVGLRDGVITTPQSITTGDHIASLFGAFGKYLYDAGTSLNDVDQVMLTGAGSATVSTPIYGLPTSTVDEFTADGLGARHDSGLERLVAVSMGTGTSLVRVDHNDIAHIGGLGMGGGTLQGLAQQLLGTSDVQRVVEMAANGKCANVNLQIRDISPVDIGGLPPHATASLFAKARNGAASKSDIAKGLICMVLETIGSCAVLSQQHEGIADFVLIGHLTRLPQCSEVFPIIEELYNVRFIIPEHAEYCTALGAALAYKPS